jgi:predicted Fe-S protein YdhL (DUF1289 family)
VSKTTSGNDLLHLVARLTGERLTVGSNGRERVDSIAARLEAEIARGTITDAEARDGLTRWPPAGEWGSTYVPALVESIKAERSAASRQRVATWTQRMAEADGAQAQWGVMQEALAECTEHEVREVRDASGFYARTADELAHRVRWESMTEEEKRASLDGTNARLKAAQREGIARARALAIANGAELPASWDPFEDGRTENPQ